MAINISLTKSLIHASLLATKAALDLPVCAHTLSAIPVYFLFPQPPSQLDAIERPNRLIGWVVTWQFIIRPAPLARVYQAVGFR